MLPGLYNPSSRAPWACSFWDRKQARFRTSDLLAELLAALALLIHGEVALRLSLWAQHPSPVIGAASVSFS